MTLLGLLPEKYISPQRRKGRKDVVLAIAAITLQQGRIDDSTIMDLLVVLCNKEFNTRKNFAFFASLR